MTHAPPQSSASAARRGPFRRGRGQTHAERLAGLEHELEANWDQIWGAVARIKPLERALAELELEERPALGVELAVAGTGTDGATAAPAASPSAVGADKNIDAAEITASPAVGTDKNVETAATTTSGAAPSSSAAATTTSSAPDTTTTTSTDTTTTADTTTEATSSTNPTAATSTAADAASTTTSTAAAKAQGKGKAKNGASVSAPTGNAPEWRAKKIAGLRRKIDGLKTFRDDHATQRNKLLAQREREDRQRRASNEKKRLRKWKAHLAREETEMGLAAQMGLTRSQRAVEMARERMKGKGKAAERAEAYGTVLPDDYEVGESQGAQAEEAEERAEDGEEDDDEGDDDSVEIITEKARG